jgi:hypothetical protein
LNACRLNHDFRLSPNGLRSAARDFIARPLHRFCSAPPMSAFVLRGRSKIE